MSRIVWVLAFVELAAVPTVDKELDRSPQGFDAARKTARFSTQAGQIMAQFRIIGLNGIGFAFVRHVFMMTRKINQRAIGIEQVAVVLLGARAAVEHGLHDRCRPFPDHIPAHKAPCRPVHSRNHEGLSLFSPTNVNSSSSSTTSGRPSASGGVSGRPATWALTQLMTD